MSNEVGHQTGWTGCIAHLIQTFGYLTKDFVLNTVTVGDTSRYQP